MDDAQNPVWRPVKALPPVLGAVPPMQQTPAYGATMAAMGLRCRALVWGPSRAPRGAAQVLERHWPMLGTVALLSRGPIWRVDLPEPAAHAAFAGLISSLRDTYRVVLATPDALGGGDPMQGGDALPMVTPGTMARLDLQTSQDALRAGLHGKWRNALVQAEARNLTWTEGPMPVDPDHWLLRAESAQAKARRYKRLPPDFALAWIKANGPKSARLFAVGQGAGILLLRHGTTASYHIAWTSSEGRRMGAHQLLLWRAILWARRKGVTALDLGTLDTQATPGLARFKLGTGARPVPLGATWIHGPGTGLVARCARGFAQSGLGVRRDIGSNGAPLPPRGPSGRAC